MNLIGTLGGQKYKLPRSIKLILINTDMHILYKKDYVYQHASKQKSLSIEQTSFKNIIRNENKFVEHLNILPMGWHKQLEKITTKWS